ncbi:MAG: FGGY-family carbohydrate kinase [Bacillota bacterium]|nr:FGGY-family carbohydrate kinase [Bacillota bacterium]
MKAVIVIDIGTSSVRGVLVSADGQFLHLIQKASEPDFLADSRVEQDVSVWSRSLTEILGQLDDFMKASSQEIAVQAISITSQRSSLIVLDENDEPLGPAIMWQDKRTIPVIESLKPVEEKVFRKTGSPLNPVYLAPKIRWLVEERPDMAEKAKSYLSIADYVAFLMTNQKQTDWTYASRTSMFDIFKKDWDPELVEVFGARPEQLCELCPPGSVLGPLQSGRFRDLSFHGVPVVSGGGDQQNAALGLGLFEVGDCEINLGTGAYLLSIAADLPEAFNADVVINSYCLADKYVLETNLICCGSLIDWLKRVFFPETSTADFYAALDLELHSNASPVVALPYFQGRGAPDWNSLATGSFLNLNLASGRADLLNALIDGICFEVKAHLDIMERYMGKAVTAVRVAGGLGKNAVIMQKLSNILDKELWLYGNPEASAIGAFLQARRALEPGLPLAELYKTVRARDTVTRYVPEADLDRSQIAASYELFRESYRKLFL